MSDRIHLLIIDAFEEEFLEELRRLPVRLAYHPKAPREEVGSHLAEADALILKSHLGVDEAMLEQAPKLQLVVRAGAGTDHIDTAALARRGITLRTTKGSNAEAVGEHVLGMLFALANHIPRADRELRRGQWRREANRGRELAGRTAGLIGYGFTGQAAARRLSGAGLRVLAYDKYREAYGDAYAQAASMEQIWAEAEVLSLHVPLTPETRQWVNTAFLARFSHPLWLVNAARGPVVETAALLAALDEGRLRGAALDVLENEDLATLSERQKTGLERLQASERVILTPHIAGWSVESAQRTNAQVLAALRAFFNC